MKTMCYRKGKPIGFTKKTREKLSKLCYENLEWTDLNDEVKQEIVEDYCKRAEEYAINWVNFLMDMKGE